MYKKRFPFLSYVHVLLMTGILLPSLFTTVASQVPQREVDALKFYDREWFPLATMEETGEKFYQVESIYAQYSMIGAVPELQAAIELIFEPIFKESVELLEDPVRRKNISPQQQQWMKQFEQLAATGVNSAQTLLTTFLYERASMVSGILYWCQVRTPLSARGKQLQQQLFSLEKKLDFKSFLGKSKQPDLFFEIRNRKIVTAYTEENSNIPQKKVDYGNGIIAEIPDPRKQADLIRKYEQLQLKSLQEEYAERYRHWQTYLPVFMKAAEEVMILLQSVGYGEALTGSDKQLIPYLADLQARAVETASCLREVAAKIISVANQGMQVKAANAQSIQLLEPNMN
ncbi:MAG: hypothetical protein QM781_17130 [Chitinophagaceae bacterium]